MVLIARKNNSKYLLFCKVCPTYKKHELLCQTLKQLSRIFELLLQVSFMSVWTWHCVSILHKRQEANQTLQERWMIQHVLRSPFSSAS